MIQTYSTTIRRKEMDAVLTCMVDEKIGPGELNGRLIQQVKEFTKCDGAVALRSPSIALKYALQSLGIERGSKLMMSALAPAWQYQAALDLEMEPIVLDVDDTTGVLTEEAVSKGVEKGGRVLLLHETEGIVPKLDAICRIGIPVIEDISQSAGAYYSVRDENDVETEKKLVGSFGVYTIMGLEERDVITAGGGAVLFAAGRREWIVLKKFADDAPKTDLLPDINCALACVQIKEYERNEKARKEIFTMYQRACMAGRHKMFARELDEFTTISSFPLILNSPFKDVKQYAAKKEIEIEPAFAGSIISKYEELSEECLHSKSLYLRCAHIPLYSRLTHSETAKITKVLGTLP